MLIRNKTQQISSAVCSIITRKVAWKEHSGTIWWYESKTNLWKIILRSISYRGLPQKVTACKRTNNSSRDLTKILNNRISFLYKKDASWMFTMLSSWAKSTASITSRFRSYNFIVFHESFVPRHGLGSEIDSDQRTNFIGANNALQLEY